MRVPEKPAAVSGPLPMSLPMAPAEMSELQKLRFELDRERMRIAERDEIEKLKQELKALRSQRQYGEDYLPAAAHSRDTEAKPESWAGREVNLCRHALAYRNTAGRSSLFDHDDFDIAFATDQADADIVRMALDQKVNRPGANAQSVDPNLFEPRGQYGPEQADLMARGVDGQAQAGLQEQKHRAGRPGLRRAGDRIERGAFAGPPREAAKQLGHAVQVHEHAGVEHAGEDFRAPRAAARSARKPAAMSALSCGQMEPL